MNPRELKIRVLPWLLSGSHRVDMPRDITILSTNDPKSAMTALAFVGQALRFERPVLPATFAVERWPSDERRIIPDPIRAAILRLLSSNACTEDTELAIAWGFETHRFRPHPFDLPKLDAFIRQHAQHLGITAQYWAQRDNPADRHSGYFDAEELDEQNWTEAPIARRAQFLEGLRGHDPARGRALLESVWTGESAPARYRLLAAMQAGFQQGDTAFLKTLLKDRATRVKALAQRMLARLSGAGGENPALAACLERIQKGKPGLFKRRNALQLELPANIKAPAVDRWIHDLVQDIGVDELASALQRTDEELVEAAEKDEQLLFALAIITSREKRFDLLTKVVDAIPEAWSRMSAAGFEGPDSTHGDEKEQWLKALARPGSFMPESPLPACSWLLRRSEGPLPPSIMKEMLKSRWWDTHMDGESQPPEALVQVFCALCPSAVRPALREHLFFVAFDRKEDGLLLLEILDQLENIE